AATPITPEPPTNNSTSRHRSSGSARCHRVASDIVETSPTIDPASKHPMSSRFGPAASRASHRGPDVGETGSATPETHPTNPSAPTIQTTGRQRGDGRSPSGTKKSMSEMTTTHEATNTIAESISSGREPSADPARSSNSESGWLIPATTNKN